MPRRSTIPAQVVTESIRSVEEIPPTPGNPGVVRVLVGVVNDKGAFIVPQQFSTYTIEGTHFTALTGEPGAWAPDKPAGTYRNEDLWHFIDLLRQ